MSGGNAVVVALARGALTRRRLDNTQADGDGSQQRARSALHSSARRTNEMVEMNSPLAVAYPEAGHAAIVYWRRQRGGSIVLDTDRFGGSMNAQLWNMNESDLMVLIGGPMAADDAPARVEPMPCAWHRSTGGTPGSERVPTPQQRHRTHTGDS